MWKAKIEKFPKNKKCFRNILHAIEIKLTEFKVTFDQHEENAKKFFYIKPTVLPLKKTENKVVTRWFKYCFHYRLR